MKKSVMIAVLFVAALTASVAFARNEKPRIPREKARQIALAKAPGKIESEELEQEHGKLVWSFDIRTSPEAITEVLVNAKDGSIVAVQHETNASEKAEKEKEKKEKKKD